MQVNGLADPCQKFHRSTASAYLSGSVLSSAAASSTVGRQGILPDVACHGDSSQATWQSLKMRTPASTSLWHETWNAYVGRTTCPYALQPLPQTWSTTRCKPKCIQTCCCKPHASVARPRQRTNQQLVPSLGVTGVNPNASQHDPPAPRSPWQHLSQEDSSRPPAWRAQRIAQTQSPWAHNSTVTATRPNGFKTLNNQHV